MAEPAAVIACALLAAFCYLGTLATCIVWCVGDDTNGDDGEQELVAYAANTPPATTLPRTGSRAV
jgi:hypothetical protein